MAKAAKNRRTSSIRVIAGTLKGRRIAVPADGVRPTADRVKETLFNWLAPSIHGARCLDLYAGTGALGIEALSRSAATAVFVERNRSAASQLTRLLQEFSCPQGTVLNTDAERLELSRHGPFDLVFLDPPFDGTDLAILCTLLERSGSLADRALIYVEMRRPSQLPEFPANWRLLRESRAGQVWFALLERLAGAPITGEPDAAQSQDIEE